MSNIRSISKQDAEHYTWGTSCDGWHLLKDDALSVIEEYMPPGTEEVKHYHESSQQFFYVLSGEALMDMCGEEITIKSGHGLSIPAKYVHKIKNGSKEPVRFLVISQPRSHGDRVIVEE
jgi:mannose-6-phosphate isomerase-like protein (cupin superfamily)